MTPLRPDPAADHGPAELERVDVVVIGAGMAGLGAADALLESGLTVQLVEAAPDVGGLARSIQVGGEGIEAYQHHAFPQDRELRELIDRLGLSDRLEWRSASTAVLDDNRLYSFNTVLDLLRFRILSPWARLRLGMGSAIGIIRARSDSLDGMRVADTGPRWFGRSGYDALWRPLLEGKFGSLAPDVAMAWLVGRIRQRAQARKGGKGDRLGYFRGGLGVVASGLAEDLRKRGARIALGSSVDSVTQVDGLWRVGFGERVAFGRAVVACASGEVLGRVTTLPDAYAAAVAEIPYRGAVCVLLELDRPLGRHYWVNLTQRTELGCLAVIEHTNFVPPDRYGGRHLVYLTHYVEPDGRTWNAGVEEIVAAVEGVLRAINPEFGMEWIKASHLARDRWAQPVPLAGGPMPGLPLETGLPGLFHASLAHIYPDDRGTSQALALGRRVAVATTAWLARAGEPVSAPAPRR
ncbi:MAG: FAD-dependent oxidoreductase [Candidatus Limnocylindrales bacterium]